jgi:hypothetical protein
MCASEPPERPIFRLIHVAIIPDGLFMTKFFYTGEDVRVYPDIVIPGEGSLIAHPGDVRDFDDEPTDGRWLPVPTPVKSAKAAKATETE